MKLSKCITLFCALATASLTAQASLLTTNSGFDTNADGWTSVNNYNTGENASITYESTDGNPGGYLKIYTSGTTGGYGAWEQEFAIDPETSFTLSFDYQADANNTYTRIDYYTGANKVGWVAFQTVSDSLVYGLPSLDKKTEWTSRSVELDSPAGVNYAVISLRAHANWGTAKFDNVAVTIPEPHSLLLISFASLLLSGGLSKKR